MSTSTDCTTPRYCRICGDVTLVAAVEPCGAPCLQCPDCSHSVMLETVEYSTLAAPRRPRQTLRRKLHAEALEVAETLNSRQSTADWSERRHGQVETLLVVLNALQCNSPAHLRQLLEVA